MSIHTRLLALILLIFVSSSLRAENPLPAAISKTRETLQVGNLERAYTLVRPQTLKPDTSYALLIGFHGYRGEVKSWLHDYTNFDPFLADKNLIIAYPEAPVRWTHSAPGPDVALFDALIAHLGKTYPIDQTRIYAFGHSNGASFATYLAYHRSNTLAAVAAHSGLYPLRKPSPSHKVPFLVFWGENDELAPASSEALQANVRLYQSSDYSVEFITLPKWGHSWGGTSHKVEEKMISFFEKHALPPKN